MRSTVRRDTDDLTLSIPRYDSSDERRLAEDEESIFKNWDMYSVGEYKLIK